MKSPAHARLAKAAAVLADAAKRFAEAANEVGTESEPAETRAEVTDADRARMRKRFRAMGHGA